MPDMGDEKPDGPTSARHKPVRREPEYRAGESGIGDLPSRLRWARGNAVRALSQERRGRPAALVPAARQLEQALTSFMTDEAVWDRLRDAERRVSRAGERERMRLAEVQEQDLAAILIYLGYRPPPPSTRMESTLKDSIDAVLASPSGTAERAARARRAHENLYLFVYRLRALIREVERAETETVDAPATDSRKARRWRRLRAGVRKGVKVSGPALLAAGAVALAFPPAAPASLAAAGITAATAAGQEALKTAVQLGATAVLDRRLADERTHATPAALFEATADRLQRAVLDLSTMARRASEGETAAWHEIDPLCLEIASSYYASIQAALDVTLPEAAFDDVTARIIDVAERAADVTRSNPSPTGREQLADCAVEFDQLHTRLRSVRDLVDDSDSPRQRTRSAQEELRKKALRRPKPRDG